MAADIGTLTPEQMLQQQQILRQQKMAEMLMQQPAPQGQMIGNRFVAPSFTQNLANLANMYVGQRAIEKGDQAQIDLAKAIREQQKVGLADYYQTLKGTPEVQGGIYNPQGQITTETTRDMYGPNMELNAGYKKVAPVAAQAGNRELANMNASMDERLPAFLRQHAMTELTKPPKWEKDVRYDDKGTEIHGWTNVNDPTLPFAAQTKKPEMDAYQRATLAMRGAELADQGIAGYGAPANPAMGNKPMVNTGAPLGQPQGQPANIPISQPQGVPQAVPQGQLQGQPAMMPPLNVAGLSPKAAREAQAEQAKTYQENVKNAYEVAKIFPAIEKALPNAHGSGIGNIMGGVANFVGYESDKNAADAELKVMSDKLLKAVPRFSGPQSDKDVASYKEAAGSIGDASLPMNVRMAALNTIKELNKPYAPNLNWESQAPKQPNKVSLGASPMYATNGNQRIVSNDGGKTWQPAR